MIKPCGSLQVILNKIVGHGLAFTNVVTKVFYKCINGIMVEIIDENMSLTCVLFVQGVCPSVFQDFTWLSGGPI